MQRLSVKHRKLHPVFLVCGILFFLYMHLAHSPASWEGRATLAILSVALNAYILLLVTFVDAVTIDCLSKKVQVERRVGPFRWHIDIDANEYKFISVVVLGWQDGNYYEISLKKTEQSESIRLLTTYFFFDAWRKTAEIAKCLNLSVYDTIWPTTQIWKPDSLPDNSRLRNIILTRKAQGTDLRGL